MNRVLLVWDSFGEGDLAFYLLDSKVPEIAWMPECNGLYVGQADLTDEQEFLLEALSELVAKLEPYRVPADGVTMTEIGCVRVIVSGQIP